MEPLFEYEEIITEQDYSSREFPPRGRSRTVGGAFAANFMLCAIFGIFTIGAPEMLPYFILLTVMATANVLYQQFFRQKQLASRKKLIYQHSAFLQLPRVVRVYEDRVELDVSETEKNAAFLYSFPFGLLLQVLESDTGFYLVLTAEKVILISKEHASAELQRQLSHRLRAGCPRYSQVGK